jgi:RsiW-degrading membrane proteinase PrsW (M82 family)
VTGGNAPDGSGTDTDSAEPTLSYHLRLTATGVRVMSIPTISLATASTQSPAASDRTLAILAAASVAVSVVALLARLAGLLPDGPAALIVIVAAAVGLKVALSYAAKSASSAARARVMNLVSTVALAISGITVLASLPHLTKAAGMHPFVVDLVAQSWTLAILLVVAGPVRTIGWRAFVGAGLTGFLGTTALARLVGRPLVDKLGASSILATSLWVPFTEELFKMLPVALVLALALRRSVARPSVLDVTMIGAWSGAGFSLYENAAFGRGVFSLSGSPLLSLFFPSTLKATALGWTMSQASHLVHTAVIALAVAFALTYGRRIRRPWVVAAIAIASVLAEHCSQNAIISGRLNGILAKSAVILTLGGRLTSLMLIAGVAYVLLLERRVVGLPRGFGNWVRLSPTEAGRRSALLAAAQSRGVVLPAIAIHRSVAS